jgi:hypothetical protein
VIERARYRDGSRKGVGQLCSCYSNRIKIRAEHFEWLRLIENYTTENMHRKREQLAEA